MLPINPRAVRVHSAPQLPHQQQLLLREHRLPPEPAVQGQVELLARVKTTLTVPTILTSTNQTRTTSMSLTTNRPSTAKTKTLSAPGVQTTTLSTASVSLTVWTVSATPCSTCPTTRRKASLTMPSSFCPWNSSDCSQRRWKTMAKQSTTVGRATLITRIGRSVWTMCCSGLACGSTDSLGLRLVVGNATSRVRRGGLALSTISNGGSRSASPAPSEYFVGCSKCKRALSCPRTAAQSQMIRSTRPVVSGTRCATPSSQPWSAATSCASTKAWSAGWGEACLDLCTCSASQPQRGSSCTRCVAGSAAFFSSSKCTRARRPWRRRSTVPSSRRGLELKDRGVRFLSRSAWSSALPTRGASSSPIAGSALCRVSWSCSRWAFTPSCRSRPRTRTTQRTRSWASSATARRTRCAPRSAAASTMGTSGITRRTRGKSARCSRLATTRRSRCLSSVPRSRSAPRLTIKRHTPARNQMGR
mmetsp:Transcript_8430/g.17058  ORF Transcript_8430/g.17058 Transcript_8430/m.17058 type:complete len:474 (-) Transcript_8430:982-2403(-)